jgi:hypothetical protein
MLSSQHSSLFHFGKKMCLGLRAVSHRGRKRGRYSLLLGQQATVNGIYLNRNFFSALLGLRYDQIYHMHHGTVFQFHKVADLPAHVTSILNGAVKMVDT